MTDLVSLETLTADSFEPHIHTHFQFMRPGGNGPSVTLSEIARPAVAALTNRHQFSLVFVGTPGEVLPQSIYSLRHPELGVLEIFLVPLGVTPEGTRYEAVFT